MRKDAEKGNPDCLLFEYYLKEEKVLLRQLRHLFEDWHDIFKKHQGQSEYIIRDFTSNDLSFDGFYPGYSKQRVKLLFIGRESRGLSGLNYLDYVYRGIKCGTLGNQSLDQSLFYRRILKIAYAIQNSETNFDNIPAASELATLFGTETLSFAFMNVSKFSNESESFKADYELMDVACGISFGKRKLIEEEIALLQPQVIITMNLEAYFPFLGTTDALKDANCCPRDVTPYTIRSCGHHALLLNTWHFAYVRGDKEWFFDPIMKTLAGLKLI